MRTLRPREVIAQEPGSGKSYNPHLGLQIPSDPTLPHHLAPHQQRDKSAAPPRTSPCLPASVSAYNMR